MTVFSNLWKHRQALNNDDLDDENAVDNMSVDLDLDCGYGESSRPEVANGSKRFLIHKSIMGAFAAVLLVSAVVAVVVSLKVSAPSKDLEVRRADRAEASSSEIPSYVPSEFPSLFPSTFPSEASEVPSELPSVSRLPSELPSEVPSELPSVSAPPSGLPSELPSSEPSPSPSGLPSSEPSPSPTESPSSGPSQSPTKSPSSKPTQSPTQAFIDCNDITTDLLPLESTVASVNLKFSGAASICLLALTDGGSKWIPVARSYDSNAWEPYMAAGQATTDMECFESSQTCLVTLPAKSRENAGLFFALAPRVHSSSKKHNFARFLEQTTFGTTRSDLSAFMEKTGDEQNIMVMWLKEQMYDIPPTNHRVFWRERATTRYERSSTLGHVTHPCQENAMYRRFTFTELHDKKLLEISTASNGRKLLKMDNQVVTFVNGPIGSGEDSSIQFPDGIYEICQEPQSVVGGSLHLQFKSPAGEEDWNSLQFDDFEGVSGLRNWVDGDAYVDAFLGNLSNNPEKRCSGDSTSNVAAVRLRQNGFIDSNNIGVAGKASVRVVFNFFVTSGFEDENNSFMVQARYDSDNENDWVGVAEVSSFDQATCNVFDKRFILPTSLPLNMDLRIQVNSNRNMDQLWVDDINVLAKTSIDVDQANFNYPSKSKCYADIQFGSFTGNPPVSFDSRPALLVGLNNSNVQVADVEYFATRNPSTQKLITTTTLTDDLCDQLEYSTGGAVPFAFGYYNSQFYAHDPRHVLQSNSLSNPLPDGGGNVVAQTRSTNFQYQSLCANVPRTFQNEGFCFLSNHSQACGSSRLDTGETITLDENTLLSTYDVTLEAGSTRYVYALEGLRIGDDKNAAPPCQPSARSRWVPVPNKPEDSCGRGNVTVGGETKQVLANLLALSATDFNNIRDIVFPARSDIHCDTQDKDRKAFEVFADDLCWQNVHPDHLQVYDMTSWLSAHPGGPEKISQWAENGLARLEFPWWHPMWRWQDNKHLFPNLGRLGETIKLQDFIGKLKISPSLFGLDENALGGGGVVVCGSPGEVANDLSLEGDKDRGAFAVRIERSDKAPNEKLYVWINIVLAATDQLRQRVAWALSQILVVNQPRDNEIYTHYYDTFVRGAFGNYFSILKEVAYNGAMGLMLTYAGSQSTGYRWLTGKHLSFPDENLAREILQLFSIGTEELNEDGTVRLSDGKPILTYSNDDIMEYSRAWTGFVRPLARGNIEDSERNWIDPMRIREQSRDFFPKMGLNRRYIGNDYALCNDLPHQHFLKRGAKFILLGFDPSPTLQINHDEWGNDPLAVHFQADSSGDLFLNLCGTSDPDKECNNAPVVTLSESLQCTGEECRVDTIRTVQVRGVFYEYIRPPCVQYSFVEKPLKVKKTNQIRYMCADPRFEAAGVACCHQANSASALVYSEFWGERVKASTAETRCSDQGLQMCKSSDQFRISNCVGTQCGGSSSTRPFYWFSEESACFIKAKFDDSGRVSVVHSVPDENPSFPRAHGQEEEDNKTFFRVNYFNKDELPNLLNNCQANDSCGMSTDGHCICHVHVFEELVFVSIPNRQEVLTSLTVGSFNPDILDVSYTSSDYGDVRVHTESLVPGQLTTNTIFEVTNDYGSVQFFKNVRSVVKVAETEITFQNPVSFYSLAEVTLRDAQYETDATLEHYFRHRNTGPFLAIRFAQRFGISNPSPGLIKRVASAFKEGIYLYQTDDDVITFGEGTYGDLAAMVAALLLDEEVRNPVLDADPLHGSLREPLIKVIALMRNLEFVKKPLSPLVQFGKKLQLQIGQMAYQAPSVFSFFLPKFGPAGILGDSSLLSPEAGVLTTPYIIGLMNGLLSMLKYGLDGCYGGFGDAQDSCYARRSGDFSYSSGYLGFVTTGSSPFSIVNELATLMTSGRLSFNQRLLIKNVISKEVASNPQLAAIQAQQLISSSSEFHSTGTAHTVGRKREVAKSVVPSDEPYKAVVVIFLTGGMDSWNLVVPAEGCDGTNSQGKTVLEQYISERGEIALTANERRNMIDVAGQPCTKFAIHPDLELVKDLYDSGDLSFFLNTGVLHGPTTRTDYEATTNVKLFGHDTMQIEVQTIDPLDEEPQSGILGRLARVLGNETYGFQPQSFSINEMNSAVTGENQFSPPIAIGGSGVQKFNSMPSGETFDPKDYMEQLNGEIDISKSSLFSETWSSAFTNSVQENEFLYDVLNRVNLPDERCDMQRLDMAAKLIGSRKDRGVDRDFIYTSQGGWDTHSDMKSILTNNFKTLGSSLACFIKNMKEMNLFDNMTVVVTSEFGRTLTPNSNQGSDHAWGGHYFVLGGDVDGGKVFGEYPNDITSSAPLNVGRGRLIPGLSFESMWASVVEWAGVKPEDISSVLPNAARTGSPLFGKDEVFR